MGPLLRRLWDDPDFAMKAGVFLIGTLIAVLQVLPGDVPGTVGYWARLFGTPVLIAIGATGRGSGLSEDEASKLRALIPTPQQLNQGAPGL